jgi:hypothetical protein
MGGDCGSDSFGSMSVGDIKWIEGSVIKWKIQI